MTANKGKSCIWTAVEEKFFFRPYFHYFLSNVHNCGDRFHIRFFNRSSHLRFSYIYSHLVKSKIELSTAVLGFHTSKKVHCLYTRKFKFFLFGESIKFLSVCYTVFYVSMVLLLFILPLKMATTPWCGPLPTILACEWTLWPARR